MNNLYQKIMTLHLCILFNTFKLYQLFIYFRIQIFGKISSNSNETLGIQYTFKRQDPQSVPDSFNPLS